MVYYLKYRPQTIDELDLESVRGRLSAIIVSGDIPHAFLFSGPRGLGKTSSARILAREIHGKKLDQETLDQIAKGSHPDVLEIDAASNRGIDEIRELRERVKYAPMQLPRKVYIIDEVHMLTREAFNALLKTLEEPPTHVTFILATTEPWKLPETILSRTFQVQFQEPSKEEVLGSLNRIVKGEKLEVEDGVLEEVYVLADGAFRDAAKILEELVIASKGKKITLKVLEETYKTSTVEGGVEKFIAALRDRDKKQGFEVIDVFTRSGVDMELVVTRILERFHLMLIACVSGEKTIFEVSEIEALVEIFTKAYQQTKVSPIPQLPLEMALVTWCMGGKTQELIQTEKKVKEETNDNKKDEKRVVQSLSRVQSSDRNLLRELVALVDRENKMLGGVLRGVSVGEVSEGKMEFVTKSKFHKEKIQEKGNRELLEKKLSELTGKKTMVTVTITT